MKPLALFFITMSMVCMFTCSNAQALSIMEESPVNLASLVNIKTEGIQPETDPFSLPGHILKSIGVNYPKAFELENEASPCVRQEYLRVFNIDAGGHII